ncbi:MAG: hypothetical protein AAF530_01150 [Pseudomonadota bacterium]
MPPPGQPGTALGIPGDNAYSAPHWQLPFTGRTGGRGYDICAS